jgi:hypothetical protein
MGEATTQGSRSDAFFLVFCAERSHFEPRHLGVEIKGVLLTAGNASGGGAVYSTASLDIESRTISGTHFFGHCSIQTPADWATAA